MELLHSSSRLDRLQDDEAGEGVISTAIAVLIMAIIGGLMWVAFQGVFTSADERITSEVESIGS
ncbi:MAG: hypothetical protein R6U94_12455 [Nitriliruptoraceae bacterium]